MNDVLNSQGYTLAAWRNRIPLPAWGMMILVAMIGNVMVGFALSRGAHPGLRLLALPVLLFRSGPVAWMEKSSAVTPRGRPGRFSAA